MTESLFNHLCPVCEGPIHIIRFGGTCNVPIKPSGWAIIVTHKISAGSEFFTCPKCQVTVPCLWVYKEMPLGEAKRLMNQWGADPNSIDNMAPVDPAKGGSRKKRKETAVDGQGEKGQKAGAAEPERGEADHPVDPPDPVL